MPYIPSGVSPDVAVWTLVLSSERFSIRGLSKSPRAFAAKTSGTRAVISQNKEVRKQESNNLYTNKGFGLHGY